MHIVRPIPKLMCGDYKLACEAFKSAYENYASTFDAYVLAQIPHIAALISSYMLNISCKDSICIDPKLVLGSNVKGPNNKICRAWVSKN